MVGKADVIEQCSCHARPYIRSMSDLPEPFYTLKMSMSYTGQTTLYLPRALPTSDSDLFERAGSMRRHSSCNTRPPGFTRARETYLPAGVRYRIG